MAMPLAQWKRDRPAVAIGIPLSWSLSRTAVFQYFDLIKNLRPDDHLLVNHNVAIPSEARNWLIQNFLNLPKSVRYLLLFDDDMTIPPGTVERMTFHNQPFVSGLCTQKVPPFYPTAYVQEDVAAHVLEGYEHFGPVSANYINVVLKRDSGVREVHAVGAACLCLRRDLLEKVEAPWFKFEGGGEDLYFCRRVREAGERILVDTSVCPGHLGEHIATIDSFNPDSVPTREYRVTKN